MEVGGSRQAEHALEDRGIKAEDVSGRRGVLSNSEEHKIASVSGDSEGNYAQGVTHPDIATWTFSLISESSGNTPITFKVTESGERCVEARF